jgi:hypothetical protein
MRIKEKELFGELAVKKGYVTPQQVGKALKIQDSLRRNGGEYRPIGVIMLEEGFLGTSEFIDVLRHLQRSTLTRPKKTNKR